MLETLDSLRTALSEAEWQPEATGLDSPLLVVDRFLTQVDSEYETVGRFSLSQGEPWVVRVRKRPDANSFKSKVTIGRANENDIRLQCEGVSKFHAYLQADENGGWVLADGGSTYGTYVEGVLVDRSQRVPLKSGVQLRFGGLAAVFYQPPEFADFLRSTKAIGDK